MNDDLDKVINSIENLEVKTKYSERNRIQLLLVHSLIGIGAGWLIIQFGGPTTFNPIIESEATQVLLGVVPLMGGLLLLAGLALGRVLILESLGMTLMLIWDCWMLYGFGWATINLPDSNPYPMVIYGGFAAFMIIHLVTLYKFVGRDHSGCR